MHTELEAIRERRNLSRAQLAVKANVSEQLIRLYESPAYKAGARYNTAKAVAYALGVKISMIFDLDGSVKVRKGAR